MSGKVSPRGRYCVAATGSGPMGEGDWGATSEGNAGENKRKTKSKECEGRVMRLGERRGHGEWGWR